MPLLQVKNLKMYYKTLRGYVQAVDDVSFEVNKEDSFGLVGESGCGKTSCALTILKLLPSNARIVKGDIIFEGKDLVKMKDKDLRREIRWKRISMIFQGAMNALHPTYNIGRQISEAIILHDDSINKSESLERAGKFLELVGLEQDKINRYPHELSGGMKQRVVTAMALACNPALVIADEPTTALDVIIQAQVLKVMKELRSKLKVAWMLITHDLSLITETCNKLAIMYAGKIVECGDLASLYKETLHPYTEKLLTSFPSIVGPVRELSSIPGFPPDLLNPPKGCRFHPRCPQAMEICKREEPILMTTQSGKHQVACHLYK